MEIQPSGFGAQTRYCSCVIKCTPISVKFVLVCNFSLFMIKEKVVGFVSVFVNHFRLLWIGCFLVVCFIGCGFSFIACKYNPVFYKLNINAKMSKLILLHHISCFLKGLSEIVPAKLGKLLINLGSSQFVQYFP